MAKLDTYALTTYVGEQVKRLAGFEDVGSVAHENPVADGVTSDHTAFSAAAANSDFIFVQPGTYNFTQSPTWQNKLYFGMQADVSGSFISSNLSGLSQSGAWFNRALASTGTQHNVMIDSVVPVTGAPNDYQKNALYCHITLRENSDYVNGYSRDAVAVEAFAYTFAGVTTGRIYGMHSRAYIIPGTDGLAYAYECETINEGSDQPLVGQTTSKYGIQVLSTGSVPCTAGVIVEKGSTAGGWHTGIFVVDDALVPGGNAFRISSVFYLTDTGLLGIGARPAASTDHIYSYAATGDNRQLMENAGTGSTYTSWLKTGGKAFSLGYDGASIEGRLTSTTGLSSNVLARFDTNKLAFFNTFPAAQQTGPSALSTGGAETNTNICTAVNSLRASLIRFGLITGVTESETATLTSAMSVPPSSARELAIDALIRALKDANVWTKLDVLYILAAHDAQAGRLNWKNPGTFTASEVSAPTFTTDRGYTGDGAASYLDSGFNPATAGLGFALNSAHMGVWTLTNVTSATNWDIGNTNFQINSRSSSGNSVRGVANDATFVTYGSVTTSIGHTLLTRTGSAAISAYRNASSIGTATTTSTSVTSANLRIGAVGSSFSTRQIAIAHAGVALTADEVSAMYAAFRNYLVSVGAV